MPLPAVQIVYVGNAPLAHAGYHRHNRAAWIQNVLIMQPHPDALSTSQVYSWSGDVCHHLKTI